MYTLDEVMERLDVNAQELGQFVNQGRLPMDESLKWHKRDVDALAEQLADEDADQQVDDALKAAEDAREREQELVASLRSSFVDEETKRKDAAAKAERLRDSEQKLAASLQPHINPADVLRAGAQHMEDRAATYDKPEGERSMGATVEAFNAITGYQVTEEQGWMFMALLKMVRSQQGQFKLDNYEDGAAYFALAAESGAKSRTSGE